MKSYKLISGTWLSAFEAEINELAEDGWVVKSLNVAFEGEENSNEKIYAVLEQDDDDKIDEILTELESINEKVSILMDDLENRSQKGKLEKVLSELQNIASTLTYIEGNTSK